MHGLRRRLQRTDGQGAGAVLAFCDRCDSWTTVEPAREPAADGSPVQRCRDCRTDDGDAVAALRRMVPI